MNPEKSRLKMLTIQELGSHMDDMLEGAEADIHRAEGGMVWLQQVQKSYKAVASRVDTDLDEGAISGDWGPVETAQYVKKVLGQLNQGIQDLALKAQGEKLAAIGKAQGIRNCVAGAKKVYDSEQAKMEQSLLQLKKAKEEAEANGEDPKEVEPRPRGSDAARDLQERKAEAKKKKAAKKATKKKTTKKRAAKKS